MDERTVARFWVKVERKGEDECWPWLAYIDRDGYGRFWVGRVMGKAHRAAYELLVGPIPDGLTIDHVRARGCRHRHCVNPAHLEPVPLAENIKRGRGICVERGRAAETRGSCLYGHVDEYITLRDGHRRCRECTRQRDREASAERRSARIAAGEQLPRGVL